jgi:hypothetical protein
MNPQAPISPIVLRIFPLDAVDAASSLPARPVVVSPHTRKAGDYSPRPRKERLSLDGFLRFEPSWQLGHSHLSHLHVFIKTRSLAIVLSITILPSLC